MILIVRVHITLQNVSVHITDSTRETLSSLLPVGTLSTSLYFHSEGFQEGMLAVVAVMMEEGDGGTMIT